MSSSEPTHPENLAEAPFDDERADLILVSSDGLHFRVFKIILSLASPHFVGKYSIVFHPFPNPQDKVQEVLLSENSTTLDVTLRHIYPMLPPNGDPLHYANNLAEFARNHRVEVLDHLITGYLTGSVERDPAGVYAIAITYGYNDIRAKAAQACLDLPFFGLRSPYLRCATVEHISGLYMYHVECGAVASALASSDRTYLLSFENGRIFNPPGPPPADGICCSKCYVVDPYTSGPVIRSGPRWLWNYLFRSALVLARHPTTEEIATEAFVEKSVDCRDPICLSSREYMLKIGALLRREIRNAVKQIPLPATVSVGQITGAPTATD